MSEWTWQTPDPALLALLALGVMVHLLVVARSDRSLARKTALAVLNLLFAVFLWLFLQPPSHPDIHNALTLLTPGATPAELRSARRARVALTIDEYQTDDHDDRRITRHVDLTSIRVTYPQATTLNILGAGLSDRQWNADRSWNVRFDAPVPVAGLRHVHWPRRIYVGEPLIVSGRVTSPAPAFVQLLDPAGDVVERTGVDVDGTFSLTDNTRSPGRFSYRVELTNAAGDVLESQPLPVHVADPEPIDLLILLSAPSFESRYLKSWAGRGGARLAIRTTLSADRFLDEFVARDALPLDQLDRSRLAAFDVVVVDQRAWLALDMTTRNTIYAAVEQDGLGLAVMVRDAQQPLDDANRFPLLAPDTTRDTALAVKETASAASMVTLAAARFSDESGRDDVVLRDVTGLPVIAARLLGKGRFGATLVTDSHTLVTAGHPELHARYWRSLIHGMAQPVILPDTEISPALPIVDQRVQICAFGAPLASEAIIDESLRVALRPQAYRPGEHCGYWWPDRSGWHVLTMPNIMRHVYIFGPQDWTSLRHANATAATLLAAQREPDFTVSGEPRISDLPRWWFALLLLVVAGMLWLEQKLIDG